MTALGFGVYCMVMEWWIVVIVVLVVASTAVAMTRARGRGAGSPEDLRPAERRRVLRSLVQGVESHYVFPEVARQVAAHLGSRLAQGAYDAVDATALAELVTGDMQQVSEDRHLRLEYRPGSTEEGPVIVTRTRRRRRRRGRPEVDADGPEISIEVEREGGLEVSVEIEAPPGPDELPARGNGGHGGFGESRRLEGNVGYLELHEFMPVSRARAAAQQAMASLDGAEAVILDLRSNTGGDPSMVQLLSSYFFGPTPVLLNRFYDRPMDRTTEMWTLAEVPGRRLPDIPLYVLTSRHTFSAAESFAYCLKHLGRARVVGERTLGGAHPNIDLPLGRGFVLLVPVARSIHPVTGTDWEGVGVEPDVEVAAEEALEVAHREALQGRRE